MRDYEILYIVRPELEEEQARQAADKVSGLIQTLGGAPVRTSHWGKRRLAYEVDRLHEGHYVLTDFQLDPTRLPELEATLKISEAVFRHLVVLKPKRTRRGPRPAVVPAAAPVTAAAETAAAHETAPAEAPPVAEADATSVPVIEATPSAAPTLAASSPSDEGDEEGDEEEGDDEGDGEEGDDEEGVDDEGAGDAEPDGEDRERGAEGEAGD